jgi:hypothetical protein
MTGEEKQNKYNIITNILTTKTYYMQWWKN